MAYSKLEEVVAVPDQGGQSRQSLRPVEVVVHDVKVVKPAEPTRQGILYLTNIDQMLVVPVDLFFVYLPNKDRGSECVFAVLEGALAKLLVPYHFMAGRFEVGDDSRLQVRCNGAGAGFVVASSEQTIEELGELKVMNPGFRKLVPSPPGDVVSILDDFLLMIQVTRFRCGGFTLGFRMSHAMCDGTSSTLFFRNYCNLCRGEPLTCVPDLDRTILKPRDPPSPEFDHPECFTLDAILPGRASLDITPEYVTKYIAMSLGEIQALKDIAIADGSVAKCSSFEVTVAHFWQARTRSLEFGAEELSNILIAVDFRGKVQPPVSPNFCGNAVISAHVSAPAAEVAQSPLSYCVAKIQESIAKIDERYVWSALDWLQIHGGVPALGGPKDVLVSAWWKFPLYEHDFGWGEPIHSGPPSPSTTEFALITSNGSGDGGLFLLVSFRVHELLKFEKHFRDF